MANTTPTSKPALLSNRVYDILKMIVTIILPAAGTLYFTLSQFWGWSGAENVVGTIAAVNVFLGAILGISSKAYNTSDDKYDGIVDIQQPEEGSSVPPQLLVRAMTTSPEDLAEKSEIVFKVNNS